MVKVQTILYELYLYFQEQIVSYEFVISYENSIVKGVQFDQERKKENNHTKQQQYRTTQYGA